MKNLYIVKFFLLMLLLGFPIDNVFSQYVSTETVGEFNVRSSWVGGEVPSKTNWTITIVPNSVITYNGIFSWGQKVTINGDFRVNGKFTGGHGGVAIGADASVTVNGAFKASGSLQVGDRAKVNVIGDFDMGGGTTANIKGDLNIEGNLVASGNKFIIHDGVTVTVNGNVDAKVPIEVKDGGTLIVNGDYKNSQSLTINEGGEVLVNGAFLNGVVNNSGSLIVNGPYTNSAGGGMTIEKTGRTEVFGDIDGSQNYTINEGGILLVHGNFSSTGSNVSVRGSLVVAGDFKTSSNTEVNSDGNIVVGGDFTGSGGLVTANNNFYIINPNATIEPKGFENYGNLIDFENNEKLNEDLLSLVEEVMPEFRNPPYQWVGNKGDNKWDEGKNWTGNRVPTETSNVRIKPSEYNPNITLENDFIELNNLTIESGAVLTLKPGAKLTVRGDLAIEKSGGLVLENQSGPDGLASIITHGAVTGEVEVKLALPNNQWYYLASPMINTNYDQFGMNKTGARVYAYRNNRWVQYQSQSAPELLNLEGTLTIIDSEIPDTKTTINYTGGINSDPVSRQLDGKGFYLFGNPYPSFINWNDPNWERERIYGTIWYRTRVNKEMTFITYNKVAPEYARAAMFPDNVDFGNEEELALIPPYQSVWIYSKTASAANPVTLTVTPDQRKHGLEGGMLKSSSGRSRADVIRVVAQNESSRDGAVIYFSEESTHDFDPGDSQKYFNSSVAIPEVYTRGAGQMLAINGLPPLEGEMDLPLSVRNRAAGTVDLKFDLSHFNSKDVVLLRDEYEDVEINLRKVNQYTYEPVGLGDNHDRFVLRFNPAGYEDVSTSFLDDLVGQGSNQINIVGVNGRAIVSIGRELLAQGAGKIEVYSIDGIKLSESEARTNKTFLVLPEQTGVYIVVVSASGERKVKKLLR